MPEVGYDNKPVRKELKTAPPDGYVELRRLPYDEILARREMGTRLSMQQTQRKPGQRQTKRNKDDKQRIDIELAQVVTREYEFANCITDHNLTVDGTKVDFSQPRMAFKIVAPEILQEIELYLSELNMEADEDELEDFLRSRKQSSSTEPTLPETTTATS